MKIKPRWWEDEFGRLKFTSATKAKGEKCFRDERGVIVVQTDETRQLNK